MSASVFKRGEVVIYEHEKCVFITDLGEADEMGDRYVLLNSDGDYIFAEKVESLRTETAATPSIKEKIEKLNGMFGFDAKAQAKAEIEEEMPDFMKEMLETLGKFENKEAPKSNVDIIIEYLLEHEDEVQEATIAKIEGRPHPMNDFIEQFPVEDLFKAMLKAAELAVDAKRG